MNHIDSSIENFQNSRFARQPPFYWEMSYTDRQVMRNNEKTLKVIPTKTSCTIFINVKCISNKVSSCTMSLERRISKATFKSYSALIFVTQRATLVNSILFRAPNIEDQAICHITTVKSAHHSRRWGVSQSTN